MKEAEMIKIANAAWGFADTILCWIIPWWSKAKILLLKAVALVEATAMEEKGAEKKDKAIEAFEMALVSEGIISKTIVDTFGIPMKWALEWAINLLVNYLNKTYGKDWKKVFSIIK